MSDGDFFRGSKSRIRDIPGQGILDGTVSRATGRSVKKLDWSQPVRMMHQQYEDGNFVGYVYDDDGSPVPEELWPPKR